MAAIKRLGLIIPILIIIIAAVAFILLWPHYEGKRPGITMRPIPTHLGRKAAFELTVTDEGKGLAWLKVSIRQNNKDHTILEKNYGPSSRLAGGGPTKALEKISLEPLKMGLGQGKAALTVEARDRSLRGWMKGNAARLEIPVEVDTVPPRLSVLTRLTWMKRGGAALAIYRFSKDAKSHGVSVGPKQFRGFTPWPERPHTGMCLFAYPQDLPKGQSIKAWAHDAAGNTAEASLPVRVRWKSYRSETLNLSQRTIDILGQRFASLAPKDIKGNLAVFTWVNTEMRRLNHERTRAACTKTADKMLWQGPFTRPMGKTTAGFGDRRTYVFEKKAISKAVHLGVDLADVAQSPIKAVAAGKVIFAEDLGIYGNCVILDHGLGLSSLYGHLSGITVEPGEELQAGQILGRSGATGLALGDHRHLSILVGGVYVEPKEWWDPHWVRDNLESRLAEAGLPRP